MGVTYNYGAGPTYTKIASQTLSGASATVTFSNLPQNYTDLVIVCAAKGASAQSMRMQFNSDTATNYSTTNLFANLFGSPGIDSTRYTSESSIRAGYVQNGLDATDFLHCTIQIQGYANNTTYKSVLARSAKAINVTNGLWRSTSAITSVALFPASSANFTSGSTFTLYGIAAALKPKATGGTVTFDPATSKWVHTFTSSGAFTPTQSLTADYLVVAGGGGGSDGSAGGAGGLRSTVTGTGGGGSLESALSLALNTSYTVTVGAGGANGTTSTNGTKGGNSVFSTITSNGGGAGKEFSSSPTSNQNGGSGAGGINSADRNLYIDGGTGDANQGYAGGRGYRTDQASSYNAGGGGGGAGAAGADGAGTGSSPIGGAGGAGVAVAITGSSVTYAGGGGGGAEGNVGGSGGSGGGGAGSGTTTGTSGTVNLGGGGGGGATNNHSGGSGGSGIVIVRYSA